MSEKTVGYARLAHSEQDITTQVEILKAAGCTVVYSDDASSGSDVDRPGLKQARADLQSGDTLKVVRTDRISRSAVSLNSFLVDLLRNDIQFEAIDDPDAALACLFDLNYGSAVRPETPWWRSLTYRFGSYLIRISGCGAIPPS